MTAEEAAYIMMSGSGGSVTSTYFDHLRANSVLLDTTSLGAFTVECRLLYIEGQCPFGLFEGTSDKVVNHVYYPGVEGNEQVHDFLFNDTFGGGWSSSDGIYTTNSQSTVTIATIVKYSGSDAWACVGQQYTQAVCSRSWGMDVITTADGDKYPVIFKTNEAVSNVNRISVSGHDFSSIEFTPGAVWGYLKYTDCTITVNYTYNNWYYTPVEDHSAVGTYEKNPVTFELITTINRTNNQAYIMPTQGMPCKGFYTVLSSSQFANALNQLALTLGSLTGNDNMKQIRILQS